MILQYISEYNWKLVSIMTKKHLMQQLTKSFKGSSLDEFVFNSYAILLLCFTKAKYKINTRVQTI